MAYYYIKDSFLPVDEDSQYEFKAHRNFSSDEVPAWRADGTKICPTRAIAEYYKLKNANRTRQPISRNICGFLNCGNGGTIMIGVLDSGKIVGISLSSLQKDHLLLSLEDALRRFIPRVPNEFIKVAFIPVIDDVSEAPFFKEPNFCEPPNDIKRQPHQLRTSSLCWCDHHSMNRFKLGYMSMYYVVEIRVAALHPKLRTPEVSRALAKLMQDQTSPLVRLSWPAFISEDNNLFYRILNSLVKYTKEEITKFNDFQTGYFVENELQNMKNGSDFDPKRYQHLQSLMPDGVIASKTYLWSILKHAEFSYSDILRAKPMPISYDEESQPAKESNSPLLDAVSKENTPIPSDLLPITNGVETMAEQITKELSTVAILSNDQDTAKKNMELKEEKEIEELNDIPILSPKKDHVTEKNTTELKEEEKTDEVEDIPILPPENASVNYVIGTTQFVDDLLQID